MEKRTNEEKKCQVWSISSTSTSDCWVVCSSVGICVWVLDKCQDFRRSEYRSGRLHSSQHKRSWVLLNYIIFFKLILIIILCICGHPKLWNVWDEECWWGRLSAVRTTLQPTLADLWKLCSWSSNNKICIIIIIRLGSCRRFDIMNIFFSAHDEYEHKRERGSACIKKQQFLIAFYKTTS